MFSIRAFVGSNSRTDSDSSIRVYVRYSLFLFGVLFFLNFKQFGGVLLYIFLFVLAPAVLILPISPIHTLVQLTQLESIKSMWSGFFYPNHCGGRQLGWGLFGFCCSCSSSGGGTKITRNAIQ